MPDDGALLIQDLMRLLPDGMTANSWAVNAGVSRTIWTDMKRHGNPSRKTLEKLLLAAGSSLAEFEALRTGRERLAVSTGLAKLNDSGRAWPGAPLPPLPVFGAEPEGSWGDAGLRIEKMRISRKHPIDNMPRPLSLADDRDAYAVTIAGISMWPRFLAGRRVAVSPAAPIRAGDDVLVMINPAGQQQFSLIKTLLRRTADTVGLRQYNPDVEFDVPSLEVATMHRVLGELF